MKKPRHEEVPPTIQPSSKTFITIRYLQVDLRNFPTWWIFPYAILMTVKASNLCLPKNLAFCDFSCIFNRGCNLVGEGGGIWGGGREKGMGRGKGRGGGKGCSLS